MLTNIKQHAHHAEGVQYATKSFGTEEHTYSGTGTLQSNTYYYSLGGRLIGELTGSPTPLSTSIFLTDALGSVLATFSNTTGSAALLGNQLYGPYGTQHYNKGAMGTTKGFTGQFNDSLTSLDYYNARYYDPTAAVFLSADIKQGNLQGMNPYDYVGGNPETHNDPTGEMYAPPGGGSGSGGYTPPSPVNNPWSWVNPVGTFFVNAFNVVGGIGDLFNQLNFGAVDFLTGYKSIGNDLHTI